MENKILVKIKLELDTGLQKSRADLYFFNNVGQNSRLFSSFLA